MSHASATSSRYASHASYLRWSTVRCFLSGIWCACGLQVERQKQDESLDELHSAVKRLGDMSLSISTELDSQNKYVASLQKW